MRADEARKVLLGQLEGVGETCGSLRGSGMMEFSCTALRCSGGLGVLRCRGVCRQPSVWEGVGVGGRDVRAPRVGWERGSVHACGRVMCADGHAMRALQHEQPHYRTVMRLVVRDMQA